MLRALQSPTLSSDRRVRGEEFTVREWVKKHRLDDGGGGDF